MSDNLDQNIRRFGRCRIDLDKKVLWHDGQPVDMPLRAIQMLCLLVENAGQLVTKDDIWSTIWKDADAGEINLTHIIYLLRRTFNELGEGNPIITVPRRGYCFIVKIEGQNASSATYPFLHRSGGVDREHLLGRLAGVLLFASAALTIAYFFGRSLGD